MSGGDGEDTGRGPAASTNEPGAPNDAAASNWLEALLDRLEIGAFSVDFESNTILKATPAFARIFGYPSVDAAVGSHVDDYYADPKERAEIAARLAADPRFRATGVKKLEARRTRHGTREPMDVVMHLATTFDAAGKLSRNDVLIERVAPHEHTERAFRASEERFRVVFDESAVGMALTNLAGHVTRANRAFLEIVGRDESDVVGATFASMVHEDDRVALPYPTAAGGEPRTSAELRVVAPDGTVAYTRAAFTWIGDTAGEPHSGVVVLSDVTEAKELEETRLRLAKLESLGLLAGGIAHDFNNVLAVIVGSVTLAKRLSGGDPAVHELLDAIGEASSRARDLSRQLVTFAKGGSPVKRVGSLGDVARDSAAFCERGASVAIDVAIEPGLWLAEIDPAQMRQVVDNLLLNAVQASARGGRVELRVRNAQKDAHDTAGLPPGAYVALAVQDFGAGIEKEHLTRVFDPYFSTKASGTGLGLATVHSIVRRHGGHVSVTSTLGKGSTFEIHLPASAHQVPDPRSQKRPARPLDLRGRVLVMDDEPSVRRAFGAMLKSLGLSVDEAPDGAAAVEAYAAAQAAGTPYRCVILDLTVRGGMGGVDVLARLKRLDPEVVAIVSSGYSDNPAMANGRAHGFAGVLPKPFELAALEAVLREALGLG